MSIVAVENNIFCYETRGTGEKPPILILHGWGRSKEEWQMMATSLSGYAKRKVYILDLPGFGGSSLVQVEDIYEYSEKIVAFCKYMGLQKIIVVGHSLGGRVGIVMASKYREMVDRLVLIDPAGVKPASVKRSVLTFLSKLFGFVPTSWRRSIVEKLMDSDYQNISKLRELYRAIVKDELRYQLPKISVATWLIWGENDKVLPLKLVEIYKKFMKKIIVRVVWGAPHDPHLTHFEQLKRIMEEAVE